MNEKEKSRELCAFWKTQVEQVEEEYKRWYERGKRISQRYRDEREKIDDARRHFNLFWSNVEVLKPAIYSRPPVPICERRFLDKDITGRVAATILERALRYEVPMCGFQNAVMRARDDYLLPGRGQVWVRYNPKFEESVSPEQKAENDINPDGSDVPLLEEDREENEDALDQQLLSETCEVDYIHWQDYLQFPAHVRTEEEIEGKGRRIYMSRSDLVRRWGKTGKKIPLDHVPKAIPDEGSRAIVASEEGAQATIYEIWWKPTRRVYFIAASWDYILEEVDDPLKLEGFFPCPPALQTTTTNDTMIPVPDYVESQDQYVQIDELTKRIDVLTGALRVRGTYDAANIALRRIFEEGDEPQLIPVDNWAMWAEKGALPGSISLVPLELISSTLTQLIEVRTQMVEDLYQVTGIADIMRGSTDARETMGAQRLKSNFGSQRLQARQDAINTFCRNIICIMSEIICEHYDLETLLNVSGALYDENLVSPPSQVPTPQGQPPMGQGQMGQMPMMPPNPILIKQQQDQQKMMIIQQAVGLLRNDKLRGFRIDVETDSTIQPNAEQDKADAMAFVEGVTKFVEVASQISAQVPEFTPLAGKMLQFAVRRFRGVGRDLESAIDDFVDKAEQDAKQRALNPPPNPEQIKQDTEKIKAQAEIQSQQIEAASEQRNAQLDLQSKQMDMQMKQMELLIEKLRVQAEIKKAGLEEHNSMVDHAITTVQHGQKLELAETQHKHKMAEARNPSKSGVSNGKR